MYQQFQDLTRQGWSVAALARHLRLSKRTVRKYPDMEQFRDQRTTARPSAVEPYRAYVEQHWAEGCTEAKQLWQELQAQGYQGGYKSVWFTRGWQPPSVPTAPAQLWRQRWPPAHHGRRYGCSHTVLAIFY